MNDSVFYDLSSTSVAQRETFSNTVVLLSLIKNDQYYITCFSRPKQQIEVAFDLDNLFGDRSAQPMLLDFSDWKNGVTVSAKLVTLPPSACKTECLAGDPAFSCTADAVHYLRTYPTDELLPHSVAKMDRVLRASKNEILHFLNENYAVILRR